MASYLEENSDVCRPELTPDTARWRRQGPRFGATHQCVTTRGVHKLGVAIVTFTMSGEFPKNPLTRRELLAVIGNSSSSADG